MSQSLELILITIMNWGHLFATVAWIGGITTMIFIVGPALKMTLEPPVIGKLMVVLVKRMKVVAYTSGGVLIATGIILLVLNPTYAGYGFGNRWAAVLVVKHILTLFMILLGVYTSEIIGPKIVKLMAQGPSPEAGRLQKRQMGLGFLNFILGMLVLLLSGYMNAIT